MTDIELVVHAHVWLFCGIAVNEIGRRIWCLFVPACRAHVESFDAETGRSVCGICGHEPTEYDSAHEWRC